MLIMISVPLLSEVVIRVRQAFEKAVGGIEPGDGLATTLPAVAPDSVHGHLPKPGPERAFAAPVEPGNLSKDDNEHLLGEVGRLVSKAGNATQPALDQWQIDALQPTPVGGFRPVRPEAIQQTEGRRVHVPRPG